MSLRMQRAVLGATFSLAACLAAAGARAGDSLAPIAPADARCRTRQGDGSFAAKDADACIRINGYIDAGGDFSGARVGLRDAPLVAPANPAIMTGAAAALDLRFDTQMGPGRIYIETGRSRFAP